MSYEVVENCYTSNTMIVTIIPFLLAAKLESSNLSSWEHGGIEVTYLVENHATKLYSDGHSDCTNMDFHLRTMLTCQNLNSSLYCHFHNTSVHSILADVKQPKPSPKYIFEDIWTKKMLEQDTIEIAYNKNGINVIWIPVDVDPIGRDMISALGRFLIIDVDMSTKLTGNFESKSNLTAGYCKRKYFITRSAAPDEKKIEKNSIINLFLIPRPDESLTQPLEIAQKVDDNNCKDKFNWYSFFAARELRKVNPNDVKTQLDSVENHIIINNYNFTSFSKIKSSISNERDNTKYSIEESISATLQTMKQIHCSQCNGENFHTHGDNFNDEKNY